MYVIGLLKISFASLLKWNIGSRIFVWLSDCPSVCLSLCLTKYMYFSLSICPSICRLWVCHIISVYLSNIILNSNKVSYIGQCHCVNFIYLAICKTIFVVVLQTHFLPYYKGVNTRKWASGMINFLYQIFLHVIFYLINFF